MNLKFGIIIFLAALIGLFVLQNIEQVQVSFLFWSISMSRAIMLFFVILTGIAIGWLLRGHFMHRPQQ
ncbi:MAG: LapA family protein [Gammaproteobacteria bacterium]|nr:LapA family protein [Gammaproteobacteria bacterium]